MFNLVYSEFKKEIGVNGELQTVNFETEEIMTFAFFFFCSY